MSNPLVHFGIFVNPIKLCGKDITEEPLEFWSHTLMGITCPKCMEIIIDVQYKECPNLHETLKQMCKEN